VLGDGFLLRGAAKQGHRVQRFFRHDSRNAAANGPHGAFTIPLRTYGFAPEFAGGVESSASPGGRSAPIMGAAFIMAETLGMSYSTNSRLRRSFPRSSSIRPCSSPSLRVQGMGVRGLPRGRFRIQDILH
jgi:hypothetical protein